MQLLNILQIVSLLVVFSTTAPVDYYNIQKQLTNAANPFSQNLTKRGMEILSPTFNTPDPKHNHNLNPSKSPSKTTPTIHGPSLIPRPEFTIGSGATPKTPYLWPWSAKPPPPSPKPKLYAPKAGPVCTGAEPYCPLSKPAGSVCNHAGSSCPPRPLAPVIESIRDIFLGLTVFPSKPKTTAPVAAPPVVVSSSTLSADELAENIISQIPVECPNCGYGTPKGVESTWSRFMGWAKKMWGLVVEKLRPTKAEPSPTYEEWLASLPS